MRHPERLQPLKDVGVIAVVRAPDPHTAIRGIDALIAGGIRGIEVTYSTPDTPHVIADLVSRHEESILLGAGTVTTPEQATEAVEAGATFLVSPVSTKEVAEALLDTNATVLLGALTPTELLSASRLGAHAVKLFPASLGGASYLRSLRGPFPDIPIVPTGGVNPANLAEWFEAGAMAVGAGGELCSRTDLEAGRWDKLESRARQFMDVLASLRLRMPDKH